jgi:catechol 2,3-dioxygenase-like lactoylglutathione lyase family enzyme
MLGSKSAAATIAVKDVNAARRFYENTLGLELADASQAPEALAYKSGSSQILVYRSQYAGTNQATAVTWDVGDEIGRIVQTLKSKGVAFEHYDMPGTTLKGDIHIADGMQAAWFKDPDGNIHALISEVPATVRS